MKSNKDNKDLSEKLDLNVDDSVFEECDNYQPQLVFDVLRKNKVLLLSINFSGGGDSGGAGSARVLMEGDDYEKSIDLDKFNIVEICEKPIYDKYYSFAFDGNVSGTVTWNVSYRRVYINGTETNNVSKIREYEL